MEWATALKEILEGDSMLVFDIDNGTFEEVYVTEPGLCSRSDEAWILMDRVVKGLDE